MEAKKVQLFAKRTRPKLKSLKTVELYGDAAVETDDSKKKELLQAALNEDPEFVYASRDLDELERRLKQYDAAYQREQDKLMREAKAEIANATDPQKIMIAYTQIFARLQLGRKWRTLQALSREVVAHPPPKMPAPYPDVAEMAQMNLVQTSQMMKDWDGVLREGERFLQKYPTSMSFTSVRAMVDMAIDKKRSMEEGGAAAEQEMATLKPEERSDPCYRGRVLQSHQQYKRARAELEKCVNGPVSKLPKGAALAVLITTCLEIGDFAGTRKWLEKLKSIDPALHKGLSALENAMPSDG
jgi:tetratricopeptide (TPR) repeat protein